MKPELVAELRRHDPAVIVIGASAGAVEALDGLLPGLPVDLPAPVLVVVHVPADRPSVLANLFAKSCALRIVEAEDKAPARPGSVYFAPPEYHLLVERDGLLSLSIDEPVNLSRPSIDVLFESAAYAFGRRTLGIVLSGANADGAAGLGMIRARGGLAWVQSRSSASIPVMPDAALAADPQSVLDPAEMAEALAAWAAS